MNNSREEDSVKVTAKSLRSDSALREDIRQNKIKAERLQEYLQKIWKAKKTAIEASWVEGCTSEYRKELLTLCHTASQNGAAIYFPLDSVVKELELGYLLRDDGTQFLSLLSYIADYGVSGGFYHCTVGSDANVGDYSDPQKLLAFEKFAVKEGFFPRQQQKAKPSSDEEDEKEKDEVVDSIVIVRHYLVLMFIMTVLMTIDVADQSEIEKLLMIETSAGGPQPAQTQQSQQQQQQQQQKQQPQQQQSQQQRACSACGATDKTLSVCSRCKKAYYCSRDCQKNDWKQHKGVCTVY